MSGKAVTEGVKIIIPKGHVLTELAMSLRSPQITVEEVTGFRQILRVCATAPRQTCILFYTPYKLLPLIGLLCMHRRLYYYLHEPKLAFGRVSLNTYILYELWLHLTALFCHFVCASKTGLAIAKSRTFIGRRVLDKTVPLTLCGEASDRAKPPCSFDLGMWGSLNREKGFERILNFARQTHDVRIGVLTSQTERMLLLRQTCQDEGLNITFRLILGGFSDSDLFTFIDEVAVLALPQYDATQSGQLPYALRAAMPIICANIATFRGYDRYSPPPLNLIDATLDDSQFARAMKEPLSIILNDYNAHSLSAASAFRDMHDATVGQERMLRTLGTK